MTVVSACYSIPHHEWDLAKFVVLFILAVMLSIDIQGRKVAHARKTEEKTVYGERLIYTLKAFQKLIGLHNKRFHVSLELKELAQDLASCDDCVILSLPAIILLSFILIPQQFEENKQDCSLFFEKRIGSLHPLWPHNLLWVWFAREGRHSNLRQLLS